MELPDPESWPAIRRDPWFIYLVFLGVVLGATVTFFPPLFPALRDALGASYEQLGRLQLVLFLAGLGFSVAGGWITALLGFRLTMAAMLAVQSTGFALVALANSYSVALGGAALVGFGYMGILGTSTASIAACYTARRQSVLFIWGITGAVGSMTGPAILGWWIARAARTGAPWDACIGAAALLSIACAVWGVVLRPRFASADERGHGAPSASFAAMREVLRAPVFYLASFWLFLHSLTQMGMLSWIGELYRVRFSIDAARAAFLITANGAGFFVGRIALSGITARRSLPELVMLAIMATGAAGCYVVAIGASGYAAGMLAFGLGGLCASANVLFVQSWIGVRFLGVNATAFALLNGVGNTGAAIGPYVIGAIGETFGLAVGIRAMPAAMLLLGVSALVVKVRAGRKREEIAAPDVRASASPSVESDAPDRR